jgi:hypothetical protein
MTAVNAASTGMTMASGKRHELTVYDGQKLIGWVIEEGPVCVARDADYRMLGTFRKRADAVRAINAAVPSPAPSAVSAG